MKPFNLEQPLAGAPVVTRDGMDVKITALNPLCPDKESVIVGIVSSGDTSFECNWSLEGTFKYRKETILDLFMKPMVEVTYGVGV